MNIITATIYRVLGTMLDSDNAIEIKTDMSCQLVGSHETDN